jgi:translation initiation factor 1
MNDRQNMAKPSPGPTKQSITSQLIFNTGNDFLDEKINATSKTKASIDIHAPVHIRLQQRNGKKTLTLVEGLARDLDFKKILRALKKTFSTNGAILKDKFKKKIIQLQGDCRELTKKFLVKTTICKEENVKVHGF